MGKIFPRIEGGDHQMEQKEHTCYRKNDGVHQYERCSEQDHRERHEGFSGERYRYWKSNKVCACRWKTNSNADPKV